MQHLKAIVLRRKPTGDDSLILDTLLENGSLAAFKIPGILKSHKRSSFHYAAGSIYGIVFAAPQHAQRIIPKSCELVFSPFEHSQEYSLLTAVAEIVRLAEFIKDSPDNAELFVLFESALRACKANCDEAIIDGLYWRFLQWLGLASDSDASDAYVAYDLAAGYLTAREAASRPHSDTVIPIGWISGNCEDRAGVRETIRRFLRGI